MGSYQQFIRWLDVTPLSLFLKETTWLIPMVQTVHILSISVVVIATVILSWRLTGLGLRRLEIATLTGQLMPPVWWALVVLLLSGSVLIIAEPTRTLANPFFFAKMICIVVLAPIARSFQLAVRRRPERWRGVAALAPAARGLVAVAVLLVLAIIFCGRWIAYA